MYVKVFHIYVVRLLCVCVGGRVLCVADFAVLCGWERKVQGVERASGVVLGLEVEGERERERKRGGRFVVERVLGSSMGGVRLLL
jgi:hypothetical protein